MKYAMKRHWISGGEREPFVVHDERGRGIFVVDAGEFSKPDRGNKISFQDMRGCELAYIRRRMPAPGMKAPPPGEAVYEIYHGNDLHAVVDRASIEPSMKCAFTGEGPAPDDLTAAGDFQGHEYTFTREGKPVAGVSRRFFQSNENYGIDVGRGEDDVVILVSTAVIDLCCLTPEALAVAQARPSAARRNAARFTAARRAG